MTSRTERGLVQSPTSVAAFLVVVLALLARAPGAIAAQLEFNCTEETRSVSCTVQNWKDAASLSPENRAHGMVFLNVSAPSNKTFTIGFICPAGYLQSVNIVSQEGFETCNATFSADGRKYVFKSSDVTVNESTIQHCDSLFSSQLFFTYSYPGISKQDIYIIGTVNDTMGNKPQERTGGQCLLGLKARILVNWLEAKVNISNDVNISIDANISNDVIIGEDGRVDSTSTVAGCAPLAMLVALMTLVVSAFHAD